MIALCSILHSGISGEFFKKKSILMAHHARVKTYMRFAI